MYVAYLCGLVGNQAKMLGQEHAPPLHPTCQESFPIPGAEPNGFYPTAYDRGRFSEEQRHPKAC